MTIGIIDQLGAEVLVAPKSDADVQQLGAEILYKHEPPAYFHQIGIEVLREYIDPPVPPRFGYARLIG